MSIDDPTSQAHVAATSAQLVAAIESLSQLTKKERVAAICSVLDRFFELLAPTAASFKGSAYDYLLQHKDGLQLIATIRYAITHNYAKKGVVNGHFAYVAPAMQQWFDDGVMLLQGEEPFQGLIGLWQRGELKFGISARDARSGEDLGPNDLMFVDVAEVASRPTVGTSIDAAPRELERLLAAGIGGESNYQDFFNRYPWAFGAQYLRVQSHRALDDRNIPDFSGVRARDGARDILEIKDPFLSLFRADGSFSHEFNDAYNQAERYLDLARREDGYLLRQKGLRFESPHCYLLVGYNLTDQQRAMLRSKERMNPAISVLTYEDVLSLVRATVSLLKDLQHGEGRPTSEEAPR